RQIGVLAVEAVDDLVAGRDHGAVPRERRERLALPRRDASRDGDCQRPPHVPERTAATGYSAGAASSEPSAGSSVVTAAGASGRSPAAVTSAGLSSATGSSSRGPSTGSSLDTATGSASVAPDSGAGGSSTGAS